MPLAARIETKSVVRRFRQPLRTGAGTVTNRELRILRAEFADGLIGFAETAPWPGRPGAPATEETLLRAARLWAEQRHGLTRFAAPCAALLRSDDEAASYIGSGYTTLKRKIGVAPLRDEQRAVADLVRACPQGTRLRLDANGALDERATAIWCDFLGEFTEVEWLEQPLPVGRERALVALAERAGVADRVALDESVDAGVALPENFAGILAIKPALIEDPDRLNKLRASYPQLAYASAFESPFGRQSALARIAASPGRFALGFGTLGAFDDTLDRHEPGPFARTIERDDAWWDNLWASL